MHATTEVDVREPPGLARFHVALFALLAAYAGFRAASFFIALGGGRGGAVPSVIDAAFSLQVWAGLWTAGAVLHLLAIRWEWARSATLWTFSIKGLAVSTAFIMSNGSLGGLVSYGAPVVALWLIQWALALRTTVVVQAVPVIEAQTVADAARERITAETGEIPEVPHG
ncbi:hypothetical protein GCM10009592_14750 [Brachybacterium rhamnosum]|uniref:Uncharacterized protein n=1 Tax=Brachybacterium rhamnosum TaxID=173361 RepID=A0ABW4PY04_9MICO